MQKVLTNPANITPIFDLDFLEQLILFKFKSLTFAEGEIEMPCLPSLIGEQIKLIEDLMLALDQKPPPETLESWRGAIASQLQEGSQNPKARLLLKYQPFEEHEGLTGGIQLKISLIEVDTPISLSTNLGDRDWLEALTVTRGELQMPCIPSLIDQHLQQIEKVLQALRQNITPEELEAWHEAIAPNLDEWFNVSCNTRVTVKYQLLDPALGLPSGIKLDLIRNTNSLNYHYQCWTEQRKGPLFGSFPDAKVIAVASELGDPASVSILDVGAGNGRNSLALARLGYQVEAVELTQVLAEQLLKAAQTEALPIQITQGNILDPDLELQLVPYQFAFLSEVIASHFRHPEQVREVMLKMCQLIKPGGLLLFNVFIAVEGYEPNDRVREMSLAYWSYIMTQAELQSAIANLPLEILSNESAFEYERQHLPDEAWPPTTWFANWATGRNLFPMKENPPMELRWILCRRI